MPACNEDYINLTIKSALNSAKNPENISFGIFEQRTDQQPFLKISESKKNKIRKISVRSRKPLGVGLARSNAMSLLRKEKYTLVVDAHMLFPENWDEKLINKYKDVTNKIGDKTLFSQHLYSAKIENNEIVIQDESLFPSPPSMKMKDSIPCGESVSQEEWADGFVENAFLTCHFIFGYSEAFKEVVFDSRIFYHFEEPMYALRLCTRGYRLVSIDYNPLYHLNKGANDSESSPNMHEWKKMMTYNLNDERHHVSKIIARDAFFGNYFGYWGAPDKESLDKYLNKFNIKVENEHKELCISNVQ